MRAKVVLFHGISVHLQHYLIYKRREDEMLESSVTDHTIIPRTAPYRAGNMILIVVALYAVVFPADAKVFIAASRRSRVLPRRRVAASAKAPLLPRRSVAARCALCCLAAAPPHARRHRCHLTLAPRARRLMLDDSFSRSHTDCPDRGCPRGRAQWDCCKESDGAVSALSSSLASCIVSLSSLLCGVYGSTVYVCWLLAFRVTVCPPRLKVIVSAVGIKR